MAKTVKTVRSGFAIAAVVGVSLALTVPWTLWILEQAYRQDVEENVQLMERRLEQQFSGVSVLAERAVNVELNADGRIQGICVFDFFHNNRVPASRAGVPLPASAEAIDPMLKADPASERRKLTWMWDVNGARSYVTTDLGLAAPASDAVVKHWLIEHGARPDMVRGYIYLDLSRDQLETHFWAILGPLFKRVLAMSGVAILIATGLGVLGYLAWQKLGRVRESAELVHQGMLAERGLTAAVLAHEIRNPLAALRFQIHSLRRNIADPGRISSTADTIDAELLRIQNLVQDYLAHERAVTLRIAHVELSAAVRGVQALMGEQLRSNGVALVINEAPDKVVVACDPHAFRQVLLNLVLNAQQAMGRGKITITVSSDDTTGCVDVADTGPGIPEEMRDSLFKPFRTSKKGGSGIGLALARRFVDNFGGDISVSSEAGHGATFHIKLPLATEPGAAPEAQVQPAVEAAP